LGDGPVDNGNDGLDVLARGQFGNHTAIYMMDIHLGGHHGGEDFMPVAYHRRRGFVA
jgi:hypothetical protein